MGALTHEKADMSRQPLVAGNWKLHGDKVMVRRLVDQILEAVNQSEMSEVAVMPPYPYLNQVHELLASGEVGQRMRLGAQNVSVHDEGAFTGEVSAAMLAEMGCHYVLVGHSERRSLFAETDQLVADKFVAAQRGGLQPVLCLGETLEQREDGITEAVIGRQLEAVIAQSGIAAFADAVVAYEPVWAIGTGKTASPEQAQQVHAFIRRTISDMDAKIGDCLRILYGGSVKPDNAAELFNQEDIDGGLIGGAALKASDFISICKAL